MRKIITRSREEVPLSEITSDNYADRLVKLIPAEIVSLYLFLQAYIVGYGEKYNALLWGVILLLVALIPFYLKRIMNVDDWKQMLFTTIAFILWTFIFGEPYTKYLPVQEVKLYSTVMLAIYTFAIPIFYK